MEEASESLSDFEHAEFLKRLGESLLVGMTDFEIAQFLFGRIHSSEL